MSLFIQSPVRVLLLAALCAISAAAQSSSALLFGTIVDEQDRLVPAVKLILRDSTKGTIREITANAAGAFAFPQLAPSTYELIAAHPGFREAKYVDIAIRANDHQSLQVRLRVESKEETLQVSGQAPLVRQSPAVATSVERAFIDSQPLNGRSFQTLIQLAPGVVFVPSTLPDQGQFSVNGQRTGANYFTVDGVGANFGLPFATTPYEGAGGGTPSFSAQGSTSSLVSVDAVQEFTIQTSIYAPEFGRQPGAQVAIVTRSGTNQFHGGAFNYLRNDKLDANSWFGNFNRLPRPALRQNDFGFTAGAPVLIPKLYNGRNRSFFFVSYEGLRLI